jgi:hypothetical protein
MLGHGTDSVGLVSPMNSSTLDPQVSPSIVTMATATSAVTTASLAHMPRLLKPRSLGFVTDEST